MKKTLLKSLLGISCITFSFNVSSQNCAVLNPCPADTNIYLDSTTCSPMVSFATPTAVDTCNSATLTFTATGSQQTWTVPAGVTSITVDAWGAQGGGVGGALGGQGGFATGDVAVTPGSTVYIYVGTQGTNGPGGQNCNLVGGFNGGGPTGVTCCSNAGAGAGGGGGASDIRIGGFALTDRVLVAAGGGGVGSGQAGATGGGLVGTNGGTYSGVTATGGTQTAGGLVGGHYSAHACSQGTNGSLGQGGTGDGNDGGGGGGGYYGGGGGPNNGGGAGGSSYIGGATNASTTTGGRSGNGEIVITYSTSAPVTQIAGLASGAAYPIGQTTNTFMAGTDTCSFVVNVIDSISPSIVCPADTTICPGIFNYTAPVGIDNCSATTALISGLGDGGTFVSGVNTETYEVIDLSGNTASCSFNVTVIPVDVSVTIGVSGVTLTAGATGATYQWLDCDSNYMAISGATNQSYVATQNGNYAVQVTENGCVDTSACEIVNSVGILENDFGNSLMISPNPTQGFVKVQLGEVYEEVSMKLLDLNGRIVKTEEFGQSAEFDFNFNGKSGYYILEISAANDKQARIKLLKK